MALGALTTRCGEDFAWFLPLRRQVINSLTPLLLLSLTMVHFAPSCIFSISTECKCMSVTDRCLGSIPGRAAMQPSSATGRVDFCCQLHSMTASSNLDVPSQRSNYTSPVSSNETIASSPAWNRFWPFASCHGIASNRKDSALASISVAEIRVLSSLFFHIDPSCGPRSLNKAVEDWMYVLTGKSVFFIKHIGASARKPVQSRSSIFVCNCPSLVELMK
jgi:hypothetical protein